MDKDLIIVYATIISSIILSIVAIVMENTHKDKRKIVIRYWSAALVVFICMLIYVIYKSYTAIHFNPKQIIFWFPLTYAIIMMYRIRKGLDPCEKDWKYYAMMTYFSTIVIFFGLILFNNLIGIYE